MSDRVQKIKHDIALWRSGALDIPPTLLLSEQAVTVPAESTYPEDLQLFDVFDQTPPTLASPALQAMLHFFALFTADCATILPPAAPSLAILLNLSLFYPLQHLYAPLAATSLASLFCKDLSLHSHLRLLQSHYLLFSPAFSSALRTALFTPVGDRIGESVLRKRKRDRGPGGERAVGMGVDLRGYGGERGSVELGLVLREVLTESISVEREQYIAGGMDDRNAWIDIDTRLSFIFKQDEEAGESIKEAYDMNSESTCCACFNSRAESLHTAVTALNFIHLDYKPPVPLDSLITTSILRKYTTLFQHLVKLMRVEAILRAIWTDIKPSSTRPASNELLPLSQLSPAIRRSLQVLTFQLRTFLGAMMAHAYAAIDLHTQHFNASMSTLEEAALSQEVSPFLSTAGDGATAPHIGVEQLLALHVQYLDAILHSLLLQRKQLGLLKVENDIFGIAFALGHKSREWGSSLSKGQVTPEVVKQDIAEMRLRLARDGSNFVRTSWT